MLMYENKIFLLSKLVNQLLMNSTESKIGLLGLEDAHTVLERGVKRGALKMDVQLEIRWAILIKRQLKISGLPPSQQF